MICLKFNIINIVGVFHAHTDWFLKNGKKYELIYLAGNFTAAGAFMKILFKLQERCYREFNGLAGKIIKISENITEKLDIFGL